ncbi:MAG: pyridoxine 5'-phosphate synthase [Ignavibacteria bacterium]|nr:pyridoxine 5'-phosphate synthase [Ignavibacteria bacterium]
MRLCINIDHVATIREARGGIEPDPVIAATICELAGADGIVCHLREDRRHIKDRDVYLLKEVVKTKLDLEMALTDEMVKIACELKPDMVTIVPEKREELTTEGGLDISSVEEKLAEEIDRLKENSIKVSIFIEPEPRFVDKSLEVGADMIEIHTGKYSNIREYKDRVIELEKIRQTAKIAKELGLGVNAGHGLNYLNVLPIANMEDIDELSIGHSIISHAIFTGLDSAVREMLTIIRRVRP